MSQPASYYIDLLAVAYDALKAVDPNIIVVAGAPTPTATNRADIAIDDLIYFDQMFASPKFWQKSDVVGAHFSGTLNPPDTYAPNGPGPGWQGNSEFYFTRAEELHAAHGPLRPRRPPGVDHRVRLDDRKTSRRATSTATTTRWRTRPNI